MTRTIYFSSPHGESRVNELLAMPYKHALINYHKSPGNYVYYTRSIYEDDDKVCVNNQTIAVKKGNNTFYTKRSDDRGFTYDKKTKKVKFWFGKPMLLDITDLKAISYHYINIEWLINFPEGWFMIRKPALLGKVMSGKITNPRDLVSHYIKYHLKLKISTEVMYKYILTTNPNTYNVRPDNVHYILKVMENPELYLLDKINNANQYDGYHSNIDDLINQAYMLQRKIDHRWSVNRMNDVHTKWTQEIMAIEMEYLEDKKISYIDEPNRIPFDFKFVTRLKELFYIGNTEKHCIYTNYSTMIMGKSYFCLFGEIDGVNYTVGINKHWDKDIMVVDQIQSKYNGGCPPAYKEAFEDFVARNQDFFKVNYKSLVEDVNQVPVY